MFQEYLYGINTISSLLEVNSGRRKIFKILVNKGRANSPRIVRLLQIAENKKIPFNFLDNNDFYNHITENIKTPESKRAKNEETLNVSDQGIAASVSEYNYADFEKDLESGKGIFSNLPNNLIVILDGITDIGNLGAILRNCSAFDISGVIITKDRSAHVNSRVSKISSGALEEINVYCVTNIVSAIRILKENNYWVYGTTLDKSADVMAADKLEYVFPLALVFGSEQKGIGRLVAKNCDLMVRINTTGRMQSLNVSVTTGIMLYLVRQFEKKIPKPAGRE